MLIGYEKLRIISAFNFCNQEQVAPLGHWIGNGIHLCYRQRAPLGPLNPIDP